MIALIWFVLALPISPNPGRTASPIWPDLIYDRYMAKRRGPPSLLEFAEVVARSAHRATTEDPPATFDDRHRRE